MPHSILKNSTSPSTAPAERSRKDRNEEVALHHAQLIQQRKDTEALILASTEALLDLPLTLTADPAHPSPSDASLVKKHLRPFQPSDYDALIDERNVNEHCGYVLCPRKNRKQDTRARYRILQDKGKTSDALKVVTTQSLEKWCSDACGKKALYIKVQLDEEPAWTRIDPSSGDITLLEDKQPLESKVAMARGMSYLDLDLGEDRIVERLKALALERGDGKALNKPRGLAEVDVQEKIGANRKVLSPEPQLSGFGRPHDTIEGYTPNFSSKRVKEEENNEDEEDMLPTI